MQDIMAKALTFPLKVICTPHFFMLIALPTLILGGNEKFETLWDGYWKGW